jgi:hypothetical protein
LAEGKTLEVAGRGTKRALGRPSQSDLTLDLSGLSGVTLYEPEGPRWPVQQLALPAFAMIARARPDFACSIETRTGAALTLLVVNSAADMHGTSE